MGDVNCQILLPALFICYGWNNNKLMGLSWLKNTQYFPVIIETDCL